MDVLALFGWRTCRETPFKNSFSSASLPTRRSRAAMRASYSASTSAAAVSLSSPPASNLATQILIRLRPIPWRLARACSDSPPRNSWTTWRLNSIECVRCLAMGFLLESPVQLADSHLPHLSTPRGALQLLVHFYPEVIAVAGKYYSQVRSSSGNPGDEVRDLLSLAVLGRRHEPPLWPLSAGQAAVEMLARRRPRAATSRASSWDGYICETPRNRPCSPPSRGPQGQPKIGPGEFA